MKTEIEKDKQLSLEKYRAFLFPAVVVVLIALSTIMILKPKIDDLSQLRRGLSRQKKELTQLSQKVAVLEGYDQNELKTRANRALKVLPAEKDAPLLMAILRSSVNDYNLELGSLDIRVGEISTESAEPVTKDKPLPALQLQLDIAGSLNDFYDFLNNLELMAPIFEIDQIAMSRQGSSIGAKMELSSYYLTLPTDIGKMTRQIVPINFEEEKIYQEVSRYKLPSTGMALPLVGSGKENPFVY